MHLAVRGDGIEVPYVEQGDPDGVPVVLLHAWLDSRRCFGQLMAVLPERIRAFAFDQRGHGDAARPADGYGLLQLTLASATRRSPRRPAAPSGSIA